MSRSRRVLIVGDLDGQAGLFRSHLEELRCNIRTATDSEKVLDQVARLCPALVLLSTSTSDSFTICRQIKMHSRTLVFVVCSAKDIGEIEHIVESGVDDFITTPIAKRELVGRLDNLLRLADLQT